MANPKKPPGQAQGHRSQEVVHLEPTANELASLEIPPAPKGLTSEAVQVWEEMWSSDVAQAWDRQSDRPRLTRYIRYVDDWQRTYEDFESERMVEGSMGQPKINPLANHLKALEASIAATEEAFGLTPKARIGLGIAVGQAKLTAAQVNALASQEEADPTTDLSELGDEWEAA